MSFNKPKIVGGVNKGENVPGSLFKSKDKTPAKESGQTEAEEAAPPLF